MITAGEGTLAEVALEGAVTGVFPVVPGQLVRAGELPPAALPRAVVRLLAGVRAQVGLQVRALRVGLVTPGVGARVVGLAFATPGSATAFLWLC